MLEFEAKKGKLHVAQAATKQNHYPTLESVTYVFLFPKPRLTFLPGLGPDTRFLSSILRYRLEDLKTGQISIYRAVPGTA